MTDRRVRILLVEDEALIAMMAEDMLDELGFDHVATAGTVAEGIAAVARDGFDAALLDINLCGEPSMPIAAALRRAGIPFVFTTGYGAAGPSPEFADAPLLTKPYTSGALRQAIQALPTAG